MTECPPPNVEAVFRSCLLVLDDCRNLIEEDGKKEIRKLAQPWPSILGSSLDFARDTAKSTLDQLGKGRLDQGMILARTMFELAVVLRWASREQDGLRLWQVDVAKEMSKWANVAKSFPASKGMAEEILNSSVIQVLAKEPRKLPHVDQMISAIKRRDSEDGLSSVEANSMSQFLYLWFYKTPSNCVHPTLAEMIWKSGPEGNELVTASVAYSTFLLAAAVNELLGRDVKVIRDKMAAILNNGNDAAE